MNSSTAKGGVIWNALVRTHHITSRRKVAKLKQAAAAHEVFVMLRSGGSPGIMYVEGQQAGVEAWLTVVQKLRYKDYQLASRPSLVERDTIAPMDLRLDSDDRSRMSGLYETVAVKDFGQEMQRRGVFSFWRKAMGYTGQPDGIL